MQAQDSPDYTEIPLYDLIAIKEHEFYQPNDKIGKAPVKITSVSECKTDRSSVHLKTNKGDWCISLHSKVYV